MPTPNSNTAQRSEPKDSGPLDVDRAAIKDLLIMAYGEYEKAFKRDQKTDALWWDGAIRMAHWILEMDNE
jgi:hypothetical protein|tara:strand:- start:1014 stop:1223 length:210 start_codon:yes stop_codon:yes gene_type:complete